GSAGINPSHRPAPTLRAAVAAHLLRSPRPVHRHGADGGAGRAEGQRYARLAVVKLYADRTPVAIRQLVTDALVVVWVYVWIKLGMMLFDLIQRLALPGQKLEGAGNGLAENLNAAGDKIKSVPGVPDSVAAPFTNAAKAAGSLANAGREQQDV